MLSTRTKKGLWIALALAAGAALRILFVHTLPQVEGDTLVYGGIAKNWMLHGIYGIDGPEGLHSTLIRLPGYPLFLRACFALFGIENYTAVMYVQVAIDLATCLLIAGFARRIWNERAGWCALWLAVLCPFTANYTAAPLTEVPELFCIALAFYALPRWLERGARRWTLIMAAAWSVAALLRPDGPLLAVTLFPAMVIYCYRQPGGPRLLRRAILCGALSILPFIPWTIRNWQTFHVFQPLAPRYAQDPGESTYPGFNLWTKTVCADLACTWDIYWNANTGAIDPASLPSRAFDSPRQKQQTLELLDRYNDGLTLTSQIDAAFARLADQRIQRHPFRFYVELPLARLADMWLRPRAQLLWIDVRWWQFNVDPYDFSVGIALAALNLAYLLLALWGLLRWPRFAAPILVFILLRCALLLTLQAPEPRYTLECFPPMIALAGVTLSRWKLRRKASPETAEAAVQAQSSA